jgi:hypothetical protein
MRVKLGFLNRFNAILPVQSPREKYSSCADGQINAISFGRPALFQEGRFAVVTNVWRGMRWTLSARKTSAREADGEVVWA